MAKITPYKGYSTGRPPTIPKPTTAVDPIIVTAQEGVPVADPGNGKAQPGAFVAADGCLPVRDDNPGPRRLPVDDDERAPYPRSVHDLPRPAKRARRPPQERHCHPPLAHDM